MIEFGLREYQLHILATMPLSRRVMDALDELRATPDEARTTLNNAERVGLFRPGHLIELELSILGEPSTELSRPLPGEPFSESFAGSRAFAFQLPVFVGLHYVINVTPTGVVWGQHMARPMDQSTPMIETFDDLQPWRFVKEEVLAALRTHELIDEFSFSETYSGVMDEPRFAHGRSVVVRFDFGLLQEAQDATIAGR
ncbi:hypothetical protein [Allorhizocola rhizosphaerae]|uniref:hypothetical protein n=1 Tax=Allorhizocola rhizosphaerae TaxID=1872709 RepID=UPI0013C2CC66|nr:hypothetical protein [Allorhizocola rhizosphaerae]